MDSLVASYASSDEEEEEPQQRREAFTVKSSSSSSLFSAIPQPKEVRSSEDGDFGSRGKSSTFLSSLPPPKSSISPAQSSITKRVVQIRLPVNPRPSNLNDDDEDDEEEEKARKKRKQMESSSTSHDSSVKSFLSAMPAPKSSQSLGALPSLGSGSGRRSILETETPAIAITHTEPGSSEQNQSYESFSHSNSETEQIAGVDNYYAGYETNPSVRYDGSSYGGNTWNGCEFEATTGLPEAVVAMDSGARRGRRGRSNIPTEIIEVKQDELMKNRPRVDQAKSTGIAFGPAYQVCLASKLFTLYLIMYIFEKTLKYNW